MRLTSIVLLILVTTTSFLAHAQVALEAEPNAEWDVQVPAGDSLQYLPGLNRSAGSCSDCSPATSNTSTHRTRPPLLNTTEAHTPGPRWTGVWPPPIPIDVTQIQVVDALIDVAQRVRTTQLAVTGSEHDPINVATVAQDLNMDSNTVQAITQLALLLDTLHVEGEPFPQVPSSEESDDRVLVFSPLAGMDAPQSKWAVALKVGKDVLVLARYALVAHADYYDFTHRSRDGEEQQSKEPELLWSRKAIRVVDNLIDFVDFVESHSSK